MQLALVREERVGDRGLRQQLLVVAHEGLVVLIDALLRLQTATAFNHYALFVNLAFRGAHRVQLQIFVQNFRSFLAQSAWAWVANGLRRCMINAIQGCLVAIHLPVLFKGFAWELAFLK